MQSRFSLDKIICIDIECTCWEHDKEKPINEETDIIEVGIAILNLKSLRIEENEGIIVKPARSKISKFCTQLTTLTQGQVDRGIDFSSACSLLRNKYDAKEFTFLSWGDYDRQQFERQCRDQCIEYPLGKRHLNLKNTFAVMYGLDKEVNVPTAMDHLNMPFSGTLHRGVDDIRNIANIYIHMLKQFRGIKV